MKNTFAKKLSDIIIHLQRIYGKNYPTGYCSDHYLARLIDPVRKPVNAVGYWKRRERSINPRYIAEIARLLNFQPEELRNYLEGKPGYENLLTYGEKDVEKIARELRRAGDGLSQLQATDMADIKNVLDNLSINQLSSLIEENTNILNTVIKDHTTLQLVEVHSFIMKSLIKKLELLIAAKKEITSCKD